MTDYEKAKLLARELDKLHPDFTHTVGIRHNIVRWRKHKDEIPDNLIDVNILRL